MEVVELEIRDVYGTPKAYPANMTAQTIAQMIGTKTLTKRALEFLDELNVEVVVQNHPGMYWDEYRNSHGQALS